jgi:hypothetical protein
MKQTALILLAIIFNATLSFSQDIITTKTGEDILAKITEINKSEIKYKKFDNFDGPLYTILKSDILMIRYENGSKEIFNEEPKDNAVPPSNPILQPPGQFDAGSSGDKVNRDKLLYAGKAEKYRRRKNTGATLTVLGGVLFIVGFATLSNSSYNTTYNGSYSTTSTTGNPEAGAYALLFGMGGLGAGIPLWAVGAHQQRKYNAKLEGLSFRFNVNPQGKGLALSYRF